MIQGRRPRPPESSRPAPDLIWMQAEDAGGTGAVPALASCAVTAITFTAKGRRPVRHARRRSTGATAIKEDPVGGMSVYCRAQPRCISMRAGWLHGE
jgi:hypothetical protein